MVIELLQNLCQEKQMEWKEHMAKEEQKQDQEYQNENHKEKPIHEKQHPWKLELYETEDQIVYNP